MRNRWLTEPYRKWKEQDSLPPFPCGAPGESSNLRYSQSPLHDVTIYTDGACSGNPGPGGWSYIILWKNWRYKHSGGEPETTNNRMELSGVIEGLSALLEPCRVTLYSDSRYVIDGLNKGWAVSWRKNGWRKADKKPALNTDLWARLLNLCEIHEVTPVWVKGHALNKYNNQADAAACERRDYYSRIKEYMDADKRLSAELSKSGLSAVSEVHEIIHYPQVRDFTAQDGTVITAPEKVTRVVHRAELPLGQEESFEGLFPPLGPEGKYKFR